MIDDDVVSQNIVMLARRALLNQAHNKLLRLNERCKMRVWTGNQMLSGK